MLLERLPQGACIGADKSCGVEADVIAGRDRRAFHREEAREHFQGEEGAASPDVLGIEAAAATGQLVLPPPDLLRVAIPIGLITARNSIVERRQGQVLDGEKHAKTDGVEIAHGFPRRGNFARPVHLPLKTRLG